VVASQSAEVCPLVEYLIRKMEGGYYQFEKDPPRTVDGMLTLPDRRGFGIEFNDAAIEQVETVTWKTL
jgi:L-alanine-DL-glutamate epimerase-like enolase superfamily enzyme